MLSAFISVSDLCHRLTQEGHAAWNTANSQSETTDVWPPPEVMITLALDPDGSLDPAHRQHYYTCIKGEDEDPAIKRDPHFALSPLFASFQEQGPARGDFVNGPMRWLLARLQSHGEVLLWLWRGKNSSQGFWPIYHSQAHDLPLLVSRLSQLKGTKELPLGPLILSLGKLSDGRLLWEAANAVAIGSADYYVSAIDCTEVYLLHHHDKIVMSIPDPKIRRGIIEELINRPELITDSSHYKSQSDDEYWPMHPT